MREYEYRKKPVVIEAWQLNQDDLWFSEDGGDWPDWLQDAIDDGKVEYRNDGTYILTLVAEAQRQHEEPSQKDWRRA